MLHSLRCGHVLVADEIDRRVRSGIQASTQDDIAVADTDSAICIVCVSLEPGRGMAVERVKRDLIAFDVVSINGISGGLLDSSQSVGWNFTFRILPGERGGLMYL